MALKHPVGTRFGRLVIVERKGTSIKCRCDCGQEKTIHLSNLCTGHTVSCGCLRTETTIARSYKHGASRRNQKTKTYECWNGINKRCFNTKSKDYANYGGRGITVCDRWKDSFENFLSDMGEKPEGLMIERKDNNLDYSPDNCIWATRTAQNRNTRSNHFITHNGKTQTLSAWAEESGLHHVTILRRLKKGLHLDDVMKNRKDTK